MLTQIGIQRYKSLFDVTIDLGPLTVFIGPNGSGKSNVCEALFVSSVIIDENPTLRNTASRFSDQSEDFSNKYWQGQTDTSIKFFVVAEAASKVEKRTIIFPQENILTIIAGQGETPVISQSLRRVAIYDFNPALLTQVSEATSPLTSTGFGVANALTDILFDNRERFDELEARLTQLVPNISRIALKQERANGHIQNILRLADKYSNHLIPASDISDGTFRILAFLAALYQTDTPSIICFEEPENGVHPWLLHKMIELLNVVSTEGIGGQPVQVLITTHSPVLLNYVKPEQVRAVEMDDEGKTQIHALPVETNRFQAAMEAYDGELGELWFTNLFGGNPE
ncbi:MAG: AAA family ATPase [Chloroflexota bacterium]